MLTMIIMSCDSLDGQNIGHDNNDLEAEEILKRSCNASDVDDEVCTIYHIPYTIHQVSWL